MPKRSDYGDGIPTTAEVREVLDRQLGRRYMRTVAYYGLGPFAPDLSAWQRDPYDETSPPCVHCGVEAICADSVCGNCGRPHGGGVRGAYHHTRGSE